MQYPTFVRYPKFIVDYQLKERERIKMEEEDLLRSRRNLLELQKQTQKLENEEAQWFLKQRAILESEEQRRKDAWMKEQEIMKEKMRYEFSRAEGRKGNESGLTANQKNK